MTIKLSSVLKQILSEKGMTLKDLSQATNVKASTLSGWKLGASPRDLTEVKRVAKYLGVSLEKLLFDESLNDLVLEELLTEKIFDGYIKIKIERVIPKTKGKST